MKQNDKLFDDIREIGKSWTEWAVMDDIHEQLFLIDEQKKKNWNTGDNK